MTPVFPKRLLLACALALAGMGGAQAATLVTDWNADTLEAIRITHPGPPMVSRMLAMTNTAMYDAWAAYDNRAVGTELGGELRRPAAQRTDANRRKAMSYAAYRVLVDLFPTQKPAFDARMASLGYDPTDTTGDLSTPQGVGNVVCGLLGALPMTGVIVRREPAGLVRRGFPRGYESIPALVEHTAAYAAEHGVDAALLATVDLAIEELFTNMVKYSRSAAAEVRLDLLAVDGGIEVTLVDSDVDAFDPTQAPDVDTSLPIERRRPGGLGLHLVRKLVADYRYDYAKAARRSTIAFRVLRPPPAGAATPGG